MHITRLASDGVGQGRFAALVGPGRQPISYTCLIPKSVPGDRIRVVVKRRRRGSIIGQIDSILESSITRIPPRCRHFGTSPGCGGCSLQHITIEDQWALKTDSVREILAQANVEPSRIRPIIGIEQPWFYRNKMEYSFGDTDDRRLSLGLHPKGYRHEVIPLRECFLLSPFASKLLPLVEKWVVTRKLEPFKPRKNLGFLRNLTIREGKRTGQRLVELVTNAEPTARYRDTELPAEEIAQRLGSFVLDVAKQEGTTIDSLFWTQHKAERGQPTQLIEHHLFGQPTLCEELRLPQDKVLRFEIHPRAFFQPNTFGAELLYTQVLEAAGLSGELKGATVLDLFCGAGTIALCLAPYASDVAGVELQPNAVENARRNAHKNGLENVRFFQGDVGKLLAEGFDKPFDTADVVVVDPPRSGLQLKAAEQIVGLNPARVVYVSCNPVALARDIRQLHPTFRTEWVQPVDQFPHTAHIENVALLVRT